MRRAAEAWIRRWWAGDTGRAGDAASLLALPAELLYRAGTDLRNRAYDRGWRRPVTPALPILSVGNLHVGGTGKTPIAARVAAHLRDAGEAPALLARGYGEDEVALHRRWNPAVPVFANPDRVAGARRAAEAGCTCAVLDDGFQHRRIERRLDLVLLPAEGPWAGPLLPRGPLREPLDALDRAHWAVVTRRTATVGEAEAAARRLRDAFPRLPVARAALVPDGWATLEGSPAEEPRGPVLAMAGIARPDAFAELVRREGSGEVELVAFPDHHPYTARDLRDLARRARGRTVATTEKDAVRIEAVGGAGIVDDLRVLRLRVEMEEGGEALRAALLEAVGRVREGTA